ncbi:MAG: restriction endonuclease [Gammaproteobacteria bacterium]|nr:restriction endonuclease [Gammaproteobacteria bacterium]
MTKDGKDLERLVQLIEKSISPGAMVRHDIEMPIINSTTGATTQCDIVIQSGVKPRETITLVEVQDRGSKVSANDFRGWRRKVEEVGAQHLICVSRHEFTKSIKDEASRSGNTISLVTLKELDADNIPLNFLNFHYQYRNFEVVGINSLQPSVSRSELESLGIRHDVIKKGKLNSDEKCWSFDKQELVSLFILCRDFYFPPEEEVAGQGTITFDIDNDPPLYFYMKGKFVRVGLNCEFEWKNEIYRESPSILSYEQDEHGVLAWVVEISHKSPKGMISVKMPVTKYDDNHFCINSIMTQVPMDVELTMGVKKPD